jgi:hypothetical protein
MLAYFLEFCEGIRASFQKGDRERGEKVETRERYIENEMVQALFNCGLSMLGYQPPP